MHAAKWVLSFRDHGVFVFPDTNAHFLGEKPQHLYSVRFELASCGRRGSARDAVYLDMWEDYLEESDAGQETDRLRTLPRLPQDQDNVGRLD